MCIYMYIYIHIYVYIYIYIYLYTSYHSSVIYLYTFYHSLHTTGFLMSAVRFSIPRMADSPPPPPSSCVTHTTRIRGLDEGAVGLSVLSLRPEFHWKWQNRVKVDSFMESTPFDFFDPQVSTQYTVLGKIVAHKMMFITRD